MSDNKTRLACCKKCGLHAYWIFKDGSKSPKFTTKGDGILLFLRGIRNAQANAEEIESALDRLDQTRIPENSLALMGLLGPNALIEIMAPENPTKAASLPFSTCDTLPS